MEIPARRLLFVLIYMVGNVVAAVRTKAATLYARHFKNGEKLQ